MLNSEMFFTVRSVAAGWAHTRKLMGDQPLLARCRQNGVWGWLVSY